MLMVTKSYFQMKKTYLLCKKNVLTWNQLKWSSKKILTDPSKTCLLKKTNQLKKSQLKKRNKLMTFHISKMFLKIFKNLKFRKLPVKSQNPMKSKSLKNLKRMKKSHKLNKITKRFKSKKNLRKKLRKKSKKMETNLNLNILNVNLFRSLSSKNLIQKKTKSLLKSQKMNAMKNAKNW